MDSLHTVSSAGLFLEGTVLSAAGLPSGVSASQGLMLALGLLGLAALMLSSLWKYRRRGVRRSTSRASGGGRPDADADVCRDLETLLAELDALAARIHTQLDAKCAELDGLARRADDRIAELSRLLGQVATSGAVDVVIADPPPGTGGAEAAADRYAAVYRLADAGLDAVRIARDLGKTTGEVELILSLRELRAPVTAA
ncbi:MAG: hypothetical protein HY763_10910 [Planctomycetes bacterium]|nr:hypothetical protein [Planctomycetota bacterium]